MINIKYNASAIHLSIEGHALFAEPGKDIVCAAVSALFETLQLSPYVEPAQPYRGSYDQEGVVLIGTEENRAMIEVFLAGFKAIATRYPDHVRYQIYY